MRPYIVRGAAAYRTPGGEIQGADEVLVQLGLQLSSATGGVWHPSPTAPPVRAVWATVLDTEALQGALRTLLVELPDGQQVLVNTLGRSSAITRKVRTEKGN